MIERSLGQASGILSRLCEAERQRRSGLKVGFARDLQDPRFARELLLAAVEEGTPVPVAAGKVIRAVA
jgi:hypothetical protein